MRTFEKTHSWIKFQIDLRQANHEFWLMLGECQSKCEHVSGVPLKPVTAQKLHQLHLIKGILATTAIEGNTLTENEVLQHLEGKLKLPPSREYLVQEVQNILDACNIILRKIEAGDSLQMTVEGTKEFNRLALQKIPLKETVIPGEIRSYSVGILNYRGAPHEDCGFLLEKLCDWLNGRFFEKPGFQIAEAIIKAILAHLYLAWIHPFGDGNGRTARLIEFQILIASGVPSPAAHLLSNHYNKTRTEYYRQLDQASKSGGDVIPFLMYAIQGFLDGLKEEISEIRLQQWMISWHDFVHEMFRDKTGPSDIRQRHLVLDLSWQERPIPLDKLSEISPRTMKAYVNKTTKTLTRDMHALIGMGLIQKTEEGYRTNRELILAFLPTKAAKK